MSGSGMKYRRSTHTCSRTWRGTYPTVRWR